MSFLDVVLDETFAYAWIGMTALFGLSATISSALFFSHEDQLKGLVEGLPLPRELLFLAALFRNAAGGLLSAVSVEAPLGPLLNAGAYFLLVPHSAPEVLALPLTSSALVVLLGGRRCERFVVSSSLIALAMLLHAALVEQVLILVAW